jgi:glycosyltransferase involved in cell wall biosynthesis
MTADAVGGVWSYALDLADALAERGVSVALALMGERPAPERRRALERSRVERWFEGDFALEWQQDWPSVRRAGDWLLRVAERVEPDVVHLNGYVHAPLRWDAPTVVVAHSCVLSWHEAVRGRAAPSQWDTYRREVARGLAAADLVVAPTLAMLDALGRHYPLPRATHVIANGVSPAPPARLPRRRAVLTAGRLWDEAKNVGLLVEAARRLDAPVELAGDTGDAPPPHVRALGRLARDELRRRMAASAVFCAPTRYEPFGLGPLEAAQAGCVLVLGDIASLRELWDGAALFVDPDDGVALVVALRRALEDHERLGALARRRARAYTATRMADAYRDAYATLEWGEVPA